MSNDEKAVTQLLLSPRDAATALSISERTLFDLTAPRGTIHAIRVSRQLLRYPVEELRRWISEQMKPEEPAE